MDGIVWHILGQTYTPMQRNERWMAWHADFPAAFVPPHTIDQDEFIYMLEGELQVESGGATHHAKAGDLIRLPMGVPHGLFIRSGATVQCLFWVTPRRDCGTCSSRSMAWGPGGGDAARVAARGRLLAAAADADIMRDGIVPSTPANLLLTGFCDGNERHLNPA